MATFIYKDLKKLQAEQKKDSRLSNYLSVERRFRTST